MAISAVPLPSANPNAEKSLNRLVTTHGHDPRPRPAARPVGAFLRDEERHGTVESQQVILQDAAKILRLAELYHGGIDSALVGKGWYRRSRKSYSLGLSPAYTGNGLFVGVVVKGRTKLI
ncbi:MAG: hypothetical protein ACREYF_26720 [Gammaproteobacteria bacterium]